MLLMKNNSVIQLIALEWKPKDPHLVSLHCTLKLVCRIDLSPRSSMVDLAAAVGQLACYFALTNTLLKSKTITFDRI